MIDRDLAQLYGVQTFRLNEAVKRNITRFPSDFMFKLTKEEVSEVIANCDNLQNLKFSPTTPNAFTEQGIAMLSTVLNSETAININIQIMRAFVQLRQYAMLQTSKNAEIEELRKILMLHIENTDNRFNKNTQTIKQIINALNNLIEHPQKTKQIGFNTN